jgi:hypothetical protein
MDINIVPTEFSTQNKKLDIYMRSNYTGSPTEVLLLGDINLPVSYNSVQQTPNASYLWKEFKFDVDFSQSMILTEDYLLQVPFSGNTYLMYNSIKEGEVLMLNNFFVGTSSVYDFSGQYMVDNLTGPTSSYVTFDLSDNKNVQSFGSSASFPMEIHSASASMLSNYPYFSLNKGKKIKITRISDSTILTERYHIEVNDIM